MVNNSRNEGEVEYEDAGDAALEALTIQENIDEKYDNDPNYSLADAMSEYEYEMSVGSNTKRIYTAINYAEFVYAAYEDIDKVVGIMQKVESLLEEGTMATLDYYVAMANFYEKAGDEEKAAEYNQKVSNMTPPVQLEVKGEGDGNSGNGEE